MTHPELLRLRDSIDNVDAALIHLLAERFKCTQAVGEYKATHNLAARRSLARGAQIARLRKLAEDASWIRTSRRVSQFHRQGSHSPSTRRLRK